MSFKLLRHSSTPLSTIAKAKSESPESKIKRKKRIENKKEINKFSELADVVSIH